MTNRICHEFFGLQAPDFLTVSATLYLPLGKAFETTEIELRSIQHQIRDVIYNPDRHLNGRPDVQSLIQEKEALLAEAHSMRLSGELKGHLNRGQHRRINEIRAALAQYVKPVQTEYEHKRVTVRAQLNANSLIRNREFAFVLYPEELVRDFLVPLSRV